MTESWSHSQSHLFFRFYWFPFTASEEIRMHQMHCTYAGTYDHERHLNESRRLFEHLRTLHWVFWSFKELHVCNILSVHNTRHTHTAARCLRPSVTNIIDVPGNTASLPYHSWLISPFDASNGACSSANQGHIVLRFMDMILLLTNLHNTDTSIQRTIHLAPVKPKFILSLPLQAP